jgi:pyruvate kinase
MTTNSRPTRAEVSDVFNSVIDGCDAVMTSGETSTGFNPSLVVRQMNTIINAAEKHGIKNRNPNDFDLHNSLSVEVIGNTCFNIAKEFKERGMKGIFVVISNSGFTIRMISKYRPNLPIVCLTSNEKIFNMLSLVSSTYPLLLNNEFFINDKLNENDKIKLINYVKNNSNFIKNDSTHIVLITHSLKDPKVGINLGIYDLNEIE